MDFTQSKYIQLIKSLKNASFDFFTYAEFSERLDKYEKFENPDKIIVLRHDVDFKPEIALEIAEIEKELGVKGTYYFRTVPQSYDENIILQIFNFGNEIGYHYENINTVLSNAKFNVLDEENQTELLELAYNDFVKNLEKFRKIVPVRTICMHGSPRKKYDNRIIWEKYDYRELGIIGEPYLDIDWSKMGYLTDTGRRWDGDKFNIRDKVNNEKHYNFKTTNDIIKNVDRLPDEIMITIHPQRWTNNPVLWMRELIWQNMKNMVKLFKVRLSK